MWIWVSVYKLDMSVSLQFGYDYELSNLFIPMYIKHLILILIILVIITIITIITIIIIIINIIIIIVIILIIIITIITIIITVLIIFVVTVGGGVILFYFTFARNSFVIKFKFVLIWIISTLLLVLLSLFFSSLINRNCYQNT